jgi:hypothetical protein
MGHVFERIATLSLTAKLIYSSWAGVLIQSGFRLLEHTLLPHLGYGDQRYRIRKD